MNPNATTFHNDGRAPGRGSTRNPELQRCSTPREPWKSTISLWVVRAGRPSETRSSGKSLESAQAHEKLEVLADGDQPGTIPSKTIREASCLHLSGYAVSSIYGVNDRVKRTDHQGSLFPALKSFKTEIDVNRAQLSRQRASSVTRNRELLGSPPHASDEISRFRSQLDAVSESTLRATDIDLSVFDDVERAERDRPW